MRGQQNLSEYDPINHWIDMDTIIPEEPHSIPYQEKALVELFKRLEFKTVLDVGCSTGRLLKLITDNFSIDEYTGVDLSSMRLACATNIAKNLLQSGKIKQFALYNGNWTEFDLMEKFDLVVGIETLMHIPPNQVRHFTRKMLDCSKSYMVSLDYYPLPKFAFQTLAPHNFLHDYPSLYSRHRIMSETRVSPLQSMFCVKVNG